MTESESEPRDDELDDVFSDTCQRCGGEGIIITCIDDLCRNGDECIHGDGYGVCPDCKGENI